MGRERKQVRKTYMKKGKKPYGEIRKKNNNI